MSIIWETQARIRFKSTFFWVCRSRFRKSTDRIRLKPGCLVRVKMGLVRNVFSISSTVSVPATAECKDLQLCRNSDRWVLLNPLMRAGILSHFHTDLQMLQELFSIMWRIQNPPNTTPGHGLGSYLVFYLRFFTFYIIFFPIYEG